MGCEGRRSNFKARGQGVGWGGIRPGIACNGLEAGLRVEALRGAATGTQIGHWHPLRWRPRWSQRVEMLLFFEMHKGNLSFMI